MTYQGTFSFLLLGLAMMQASAAILRPPIVGGLPTILPYNPLVEILPPLVDAQALSALSCGCGGPAPCGCGPTVDCRIPTSISPVVTPPCGCGCGVPTATYRSPYTIVNGYGAVPGSGCVAAPACGCGCVATTPLTPPFPPVVGCTKYLRQVCVQPPFL